MIINEYTMKKSPAYALWGWTNELHIEHLTSLVLSLCSLDRRLSALITSDPLPRCLRKPLCNAVTWLLPDHASHHPRSSLVLPHHLFTSQPTHHTVSLATAVCDGDESCAHSLFMTCILHVWDVTCMYQYVCLMESVFVCRPSSGPSAGE